MYYEQGKLEQAIATYREALVAEPNFPEAYNNLGNALREVRLDFPMLGECKAAPMLLRSEAAHLASKVF